MIILEKYFYYINNFLVEFVIKFRKNYNNNIIIKLKKDKK